MKTFSAKPLEVKREWYVVDATDKVVGRLAAEIALRLRGKDKPEYTPHVDTGDYIIVVNADKLVMTGAKAEDKNPSVTSSSLHHGLLIKSRRSWAKKRRALKISNCLAG